MKNQETTGINHETHEKDWNDLSNWDTQELLKLKNRLGYQSHIDSISTAKVNPAVAQAAIFVLRAFNPTQPSTTERQPQYGEVIQGISYILKLTQSNTQWNTVEAVTQAIAEATGQEFTLHLPTKPSPAPVRNFQSMYPPRSEAQSSRAVKATTESTEKTHTDDEEPNPNLFNGSLDALPDFIKSRISEILPQLQAEIIQLSLEGKTDEEIIVAIPRKIPLTKRQIENLRSKARVSVEREIIYPSGLSRFKRMGVRTKWIREGDIEGIDILGIYYGRTEELEAIREVKNNKVDPEFVAKGYLVASEVLTTKEFATIRQNFPHLLTEHKSRKYITRFNLATFRDLQIKVDPELLASGYVLLSELFRIDSPEYLKIISDYKGHLLKKQGRLYVPPEKKQKLIRLMNYWSNTIDEKEG